MVGIILSAGNSSRMKSPKAILKYKNEFFIEIVLNNLRKLKLNEIFIVLGKDKDKILENIKLNNEKVIYNDNVDLGQIHSLRLALKEINENESFLISLVDQPLIKFETYEKIKNFFDENSNSIVIPKVFLKNEKRFKRGHPIIISSLYKDLCFKGPINEGLHWVTHNENVKVKDLIVDDEGILIDIDNIEEYNNIK